MPCWHTDSLAIRYAAGPLRRIIREENRMPSDGVRD